MTEFEYQQILTALISKYGMEALDRLDYWELEELMQEEARLNELR